MKLIRIFIIFLVFLAGCVYYNTLFNAKKAFKEAEELRLQNGKVPNSAKSKYNIVIKKCAYIVKEYKNSKYADDALFLLSKALFYKGANYTLAIENFKQLIEFYPKSEYVPEAKIFIARAKYKLDKKGEAYTLLQNILESKIDEKYKTQTLFLLAKYYSEDENYEEAIKYLNRIIENHKKSKEYSHALFMLGEIYYKQKKYQKSLEIFQKISKQKRFEKRIQLDALYYVALNNYELKNTDLALKIITKLLLRETRNAIIPKLRLLNARILVQKKEYNKAITLFNAIIKDNRRTKISAEAAYRIGEVYFNDLKDYQKAIEYYNKVKVERKDSEFNEDAIIKSSIASQIIQYHNPPKNIDPLSLINQQMKLAEYYFDILQKPDSTFKIYNQILTFKDTLQTKLDTIMAEINAKTATIDSTDSLNYVNKKNKLDALMQKKENYLNIMKTYNREIIPKIYFNKIWIYKKVYKDTAKAKEVFQVLKTKYPNNRYRYAAEEFLAGKEVEFITPKIKSEWETYRKAVAIMDSLPEKAKEQLLQIKDTKDEKLKMKTNFTLGYICYFELGDTLDAKNFFDKVLEDNTYSSFIRKFYDGKKFVIIDSLDIPNTLDEEDEKSNTTKE